MSFNTALSGLRAANQDLSVTGNNIANASTTGFKQSRAEFADVYANSILGTGSRTAGSGVLVANIAQQFGQGNISITGNSLDLAISGQGFFVLNDRGSPVYTRSGIFGLDKDGFVVGGNNARLQGYRANATGTQIVSGAPTDLRIQTADIAPEATTAVDMTINLDSDSAIKGWGPLTGSAAPAGFDFTTPTTFTVQVGNGAAQTVTLDEDYVDADGLAAAIQSQLTGVNVSVSGGALSLTPTGTSGGEPVVLGGAGADALFGTAPVQDRLPFDPANPNNYNWSTAATIYDSLGNPHVLTTYYVKSGQDAAGTTWDVYATLDGVQPTPADPVGQLAFSTNGGLNASTPLSLNGLWAPPPGAAALNFNVNYGNSTQFGSEFSVNALTQDGYAPGRLSGINIDDTGVVFARYTNGQALMLGQVALANFANPQGLSPIGNTQWAESFDSGQPVVGAPQTASLGSIQAGALEDSNVDLSDQLVNLIIAQRNYQANAKTIETANAVTQTIINLR